ncbi:MAG: enoyl-CoA hydratase/isomerase family protein [Candidatus Aminicenantes bacterium]|nr:enoyl-CoA hydratase/isomerase family protein [Candidatus Aminicenantes bacterium]MDH5386021.1 enoyl-CoA hydratase/isomerase family protein [Candidatus Aminicenantes bacterium]MDH5742924.1 enoyl-CoA hydratase/isomerase family protein [Candidatus Aminicenantes bacterium]
MSYENIIFDVKESKAILTINRPPMNILNIATMEEMNHALSSIADNKDIKVLVITSTGEKAFSAGVDVSEHTEEKVEQMLHVFHDIFRNFAKLNQVIVAATKGFSLGGGCEVAIFCDLIFAADNLKIGQPEIKLSAIPPIALLIMPRLVGLKNASELLLSGKIIDAQKAIQIGLINKVVPLDSFDSELESYIQPFTELSFVGLKFSKRGIQLGLETSFLEGLEKIEKMYLEELMASEDAHEGLKAFMEKRKPAWKNQ